MKTARCREYNWMLESARCREYKSLHDVVIIETYPLVAYTFPEEARIHSARVDDEYLHIELTDKRLLSIPLVWIPSLYDATAKAHNAFEINPRRTMLIWDPDTTGINDEISIEDYLGPMYTPTTP